MKLMVLGNTGPYPGPGGACSGYLLESGDTRMVMDFGNGTLANLQKHHSIDEISLIICSHLHADHISDLFVLRYALEQKKLMIPLFVPSEPPLELASLYYKNVYTIKTLSEELVLKPDHLTITFKKLKHSFLDYAIKITDGETTFLYTGDTCYTPALGEFAKGVDVMLCDGAFLEDVVSDKHLSVKEACEIANEAGVKTLILTHFAPFEDPQAYLSKGEKLFKGALYVTEIGKSFDIKALSKN
ncbi:beta-lactamase [Acetobacterium bakii]|uniref:Beta-lactamase n=2 Tax=Acetobacterium bakii TaxID=52689 RepID=A0A0L6TWI5_9FIRM|nr:MBL fold metallo-hydrolase [Acetobacterium bakii]KNZ40422.1 beta-lactamase [Acetobacterium bakii]